MNEAETIDAYVLPALKAAGRPVCFYILFEHQSRPARIMPLRVLEYIGLIWQKHRGDIESGGKLCLSFRL